MSNSELACVYAALILADDDVAITVSTLKFEDTFFNKIQKTRESETRQNCLHWFGGKNSSKSNVLKFPFQAEKISTILKAASVDVEPFWPGLFAKCLESCNIKDLISNVGSGVGSAPAAGGAPAGGAAAPAAEEKKEEKKEEPEEESDDDMGFGLFD